MATTSRSSSGGCQPADFEVFLPNVEQVLDQDEEWCEVRTGGEVTRIRFHDYHEIYDIPGLYERVFHDLLRCASPRVMAGLIWQALSEQGAQASGLRVLDVGAGNGIVGEHIRALGASVVYGIDIIPEAADATARDRPGLYDRYLVADLTALTSQQRATLVGAELNTLTVVAALGFADIPPRAFAEAFNLIATPGWVAFNLKEEFFDGTDESGFSRLIRRMLDEQVIVPLARQRYQHRLSVRGEPLHYLGFAARKDGGIPEAWLG